MVRSTADGEAAAARLAQGEPVRQVLPGDDASAWTALDAGVRACHLDERLWLPDWERIPDGRIVAALVRERRPLTEAQLALALCHRDGRIRWAALGRAAEHPGLLPLVVVRCSDWVPQVREPARRLLAETLDAGTAVRLLPLILRVGRRDRGDFATGLATALLRTAPPRTLAPLYTHDDRAARRYAHRLAVDEGLLSPAELARTAARDSDTVVQSLCADAALAALADGAHGDVLEPLLAARGPRARSAGVTALRRAGRPERAVEFLSDRSGLVRACARYVVRQHGGDPSAWYRERCADPAGVSPGAVLGLAECGERQDAVLLWPLLRHPAAAVRAGAVAGLRTLDVTDIARLLPSLDDPSPAVVRRATLSLLPSAGSLDTGPLTRRTGTGWPPHVRIAAFRLLKAHSVPARLRTAVALADDENDRLRTLARRSLRDWGFAMDPRGRAETEELLDRARRRIDELTPARPGG
ncbi:hypothetical protein JCM4814A_62310 [Streptomyces phaeofaciens JCM 4814]|uniref:HEAT repeat domain-containing protein n=1 Tax=Streptomyces phaeofaciens TaxID=68254 RepID=A0A918LYT6_9ACTN|nr:hypothetical protein [Streptomyces phaeofaciens]GGT71952.1 hypothetical protein GCM10010226_57360 [Streptomyces phaeofaciens]